MHNGRLAVHAPSGRLGILDSEFKFGGKVRTLLLVTGEGEMLLPDRKYCGDIRMTLPPTRQAVAPRIPKIQLESEVAVLVDTTKEDYADTLALISQLSVRIPVVVLSRSSSPALGARFYHHGACCVVDGWGEECGPILERIINTYGIYSLLCPFLDHRMSSNLVIRSVTYLFTCATPSVSQWAKRLGVTSRALLKFWRMHSGISPKDALFLFRVIQSQLESNESGVYLHSSNVYPGLLHWRSELLSTDRQRLACFPSCVDELLRRVRGAG